MTTFFNMLMELENKAIDFRVMMDTEDEYEYFIKILVKGGDIDAAQNIFREYLINKDLRTIHTELYNDILVEEIYDYLGYKIVIEY